MKSKLRFELFGLLFLLIATSMSCEEKTEWNFQPDNIGRIAVTAIITNENKIQSVEIFRSTATPEDIAIGITNAEVRLYTTDNSIAFIHDASDPGTYLSPIAFATPSNRTLRLEIMHEGELYEASTELGTVTTIPELQIGIHPNTQRRFIAKIADLYSPIEQAMYELDLDWSGLEPDTINKALLYAYTFSSVDISGIIPAADEDISFPAGTIILEKKFGLTSDYAEFLRSLAIETSWQGGAFDEAQSSLQSNISNNALGYFTACQVLSDTIIVQ